MLEIRSERAAPLPRNPMPGRPTERRLPHVAEAALCIRARRLAQYCEEAARRGIDTGAMLAEAELSPDALADPAGLIAIGDVRRFLLALASRAPEDFGVRFGLGWTISTVSLFGYALSACRTYGEYIDRWQDHFEFSGFPMRSRSIVDGEGWRIEWTRTAALPDTAFRLCMQDIWATFWPACRQLTGAELHAIRIETTAADDATMRTAAQILDVPIVCGAERDCIIMPLRYRGLPLRVAEDAFGEYCSLRCREIGAELMTEPLLSRVREILILSPARAPQLSEVAHRLDLSKRSLNRALEALGWTFTEIVACYRRDLTFALLATNELTVKEIAAIVGFGSTESLRRAFREWTGAPITRWTRTELGTTPPRRFLPAAR